MNELRQEKLHNLPILTQLTGDRIRIYSHQFSSRVCAQPIKTEKDIRKFQLLTSEEENGEQKIIAMCFLKYL